MTTTLDWYGCATFALRTAGLTVFLDAYIDRAETAAGPGVRAADVAEADWILIGHSHFDHLWGAHEIMANTDATLIGSYESIRVLEQAGIDISRCMCVGGGETIKLSDEVSVSVFPSQHSCVWSHREMDQPDVVCIGDLGVDFAEQQRRMEELMSYLASEVSPEVVNHIGGASSGHSDRGDGGALVYLIETPEGSLLFQDTSGHWSGIMRDLRPDVAILAVAGRANIDGEPIQGTLAQFIGKQVDLLRPQKVLFCHHDNWLPGFSIPTDLTSVREEISRVRPGTTVLEPGYLAATPIFE